MSVAYKYREPDSMQQTRSNVEATCLSGRVCTIIFLLTAGYAGYFGCEYLASIADASIKFEHTSWAAGSVVAFGLASSELFWINLWSLNRSIMRRVILSSATTAISIAAVGVLSPLLGINLRNVREPRFGVWIGLAAIVFAVIALFIRLIEKLIVGQKPFDQQSRQSRSDGSW